MSFPGFPEQALDFYEGLEADNTKAYWSDHKAVYEQCVREPLLALCAVVEPEFGPAKVFRPYRDVRFSRDESPYKTAQGALLRGAEGDESFYVQVGAAGLLVAAGYHEMASDQVQRYRAAVEDDVTGDQLRDLVDDLEARGHRVEGDVMKTRPRGVDPDHPRLHLLRHRTLVAVHQYPPDPWLHTPHAADVVVSTWREMQPLGRWLARHVGASHLPRR
jgi:uncharacterized protein (TIGR02453 family)